MANLVVGIEDLEKSLQRLGPALGTKVLRRAMLKVTQPTMRRMRSQAPVGTVGHRIYNKRLVRPGLLRRSIRKGTRILHDRGVVTLTIRVDGEAFYGRFYEFGDYTISRRKNVVLKHEYTLKKKQFFNSVFEADEPRIASEFFGILSTEIDKAWK